MLFQGLTDQLILAGRWKGAVINFFFFSQIETVTYFMIPTPFSWGFLCKNFSEVLLELYMTSKLILEEFVTINVIIINAKGINKDFLLVVKCRSPRGFAIGEHWGGLIFSDLSD